MAIPFALSPQPQSQVRALGPFKSSTGNYYIIGIHNSSNSSILVWKASDPSSSWTTGNTQSFGNTIYDMTAHQHGDIIHIAVQYGATVSASSIQYCQLNLATDAFQTVEAVHTNFNPQNVGNDIVGLSIVYRTSDSQPIILYNGPQVANMGSSYSRIVYARRTGTSTWTTNVAVDALGQLSGEQPCAVVDPTDKTRIYFFYTYAGATNHRTLNTSNTLGTVYNGGQIIFAGNSMRGIAWDASGSRKVLCGLPASTPKVLYFNAADAPSPYNTVTPTQLASSSWHRFFVDGATVYCLFRFATDGDLYVSSTADFGATWTTKTLVRAAGTVQDAQISREAVTYQRAANLVIPLLYYDGSWVYDEYTIRASNGWNSFDRQDITLSNSDKTATASASTGGTRSPETKSSGKYYVEFLLGSGTPCIGLKSITSTLTTQSTDAVYIYPSDGNVRINGTSQGNVGIGAFAVNDIICLAWDATARKLWYRKNGDAWNPNLSGDPGAGTGGYDISAIPSALAFWFGTNATGNIATVRVAAAELTQTAPSGFVSWIGESLFNPNVSVNVTGQQLTVAVGVEEVRLPPVSANVTTNLLTTTVGTGTTVQIPVNANVLTNLLTTAAGQVAPTGKANVSVTTNLATVTVGKADTPVRGQQLTTAAGQVTVSIRTDANVLTNLLTTTAGQVAPTGKASVNVLTNLATMSVGQVTVTLITIANVAVTGQQLAVNVTRVGAGGEPAEDGWNWKTAVPIGMNLTDGDRKVAA